MNELLLGKEKPASSPRLANTRERAARMLAGDRFPPIIVAKIGPLYEILDGFHRTRAARHIGRKTIAADIAVWFP